MKKRMFVSGIIPLGLMAVLLSGCLAPAPDVPRNWVVMPRADKVMRAASPSFGAARFATITVRAPYDRSTIAIRRADGSLAFDTFNVFAAPPAALLKGAVGDILSNSGIFKYVVPSHSNAATEVLVEISVCELVLDCREPGQRDAVVTCIVRLVSHRDMIACAFGEGRSPTTSGNYTEAFSTAFTAALVNALSEVVKESVVKNSSAELNAQKVK